MLTGRGTGRGKMPVTRILPAAALLLPLLACGGSPSAPSSSVPDVSGKYAGHGHAGRATPLVLSEAWPALQIDVRQEASRVEITGELISVTGFISRLDPENRRASRRSGCIHPTAVGWRRLHRGPGVLRQRHHDDEPHRAVLESLRRMGGMGRHGRMRGSALFGNADAGAMSVAPSSTGRLRAPAGTLQHRRPRFSLRSGRQAPARPIRIATPPLPSRA